MLVRYQMGRGMAWSDTCAAPPRANGFGRRSRPPPVSSAAAPDASEPHLGTVAARRGHPETGAATPRIRPVGSCVGRRGKGRASWS